MRVKTTAIVDESSRPMMQAEALFEVGAPTIPVIVYASECGSCQSVQVVRPFDRVAIVATPEGAKHGGNT